MKEILAKTVALRESTANTSTKAALGMVAMWLRTAIETRRAAQSAGGKVTGAAKRRPKRHYSANAKKTNAARWGKKNRAE